MAEKKCLITHIKESLWNGEDKELECKDKKDNKDINFSI